MKTMEVLLLRLPTVLEALSKAGEKSPFLVKATADSSTPGEKAACRDLSKSPAVLRRQSHS